MMKQFFSITCLTLLIAVSLGCESGTESSASELKYADFDSELAEQLGADNYGMKRYVMAVLKSGPNRPDDPDVAAELQQKHMENINRLAEEGSLILSGPFLDGGEMRGIFIFNVETVDEARELTESDPAVQAGSLRMELHPWYGSAALMQVNDIHRQISRETP